MQVRENEVYLRSTSIAGVAFQLAMRFVFKIFKTHLTNENKPKRFSGILHSKGESERISL